MKRLGRKVQRVCLTQVLIDLRDFKLQSM